MLILEKWDIKFKSEWKTAILATWIVGLLAHAYKFFNFLPTWDSIYNFTGVGATYGLGRWFLSQAGLISSNFDLPWINGALSLFYISIVMILLVELFQIRKKALIGLCAAVFVSFPTVVSSFAYMYTADAYMLAFLLVVLAVFLTCRIKKWGMFLGMLCLGFGMGIYQAYAAIAIVLVLLWIIQQFVIEKTAFFETVKKDLKYLGMLIGGAFVYLIILKLTMLYYDMDMSGYQGIGSMGILSLAEYKAGLIKTKYRFQLMMGLENGFMNRPYTLLNTAILLILSVLLIYLAVKNRIYEKKLSFLAAVAAVLLIPVGAYAINFTSPDVEYHTLMEMGVCFVYLLVIILLNQLEWKSAFPKVLRVCGLAAMCGLVYYNVLNCNIAYYNMNLSYQKSYAIAENVLDRIENTDEFLTATNTVALIGRYDCPTENLHGLVPNIMGVSNDSFLNDPNHYTVMWRYCFGIEINLASYEEMSAIKETEEFKSMAVYPAKDSVKYIDGIIVIRLSE